MERKLPTFRGVLLGLLLYVALSSATGALGWAELLALLLLGGACGRMLGGCPAGKRAGQR